MNARDLLVLGADDDELNLLGQDDEDALGAVPARRGLKSKKRALVNAIKSEIPGAPNQEPKMWPLPFPLVTFTAVSGTALDATARTQRPYKGSRITTVVGRVGASAAGILVGINTLLVGQVNQLAGRGTLPGEMFSPTSFDNSLAITNAEPGIDIIVGYTVTAGLAGADRIDVATALVGLSYG